MGEVMKFLGLATDYDGTIARHGDVNDGTRAALERWRAAGKKLLLVTGRELPDLAKVCSFTGDFDGIVAENGAVLYWPATKEKRILAPPAPPEFIECLRGRGVTPLSIGEVIVATLENYKGVVLETIADLELKWKVILNKGAVMALPVHVDKATGLAEALAAMQLSAGDIVGVGDAENDQVFLSACGYSVAVGNALGFLKKQVHYVTRATHGAGVEELIDKLLDHDTDRLPPPTVQQEFSGPTFNQPGMTEGMRGTGGEFNRR
jgi:HAD superfamily hydrolase (TIGR01484 family)